VLAPAAFALAAPRLAALPVQDRSASVPPIPTPRPDALPTLSGLVDPLPLVVRDFQDEASRLSSADYDAASLLDPEDAAAMVEHARQALIFDQALRVPVDGYISFLLFGGGYSVPGNVVIEEPRVEARVAMEALTSDPRNADHLNNLAVALFALGTANSPGSREGMLYAIDAVTGEEHRSLVARTDQPSRL
jgi:hypothetical protein